MDLSNLGYILKVSSSLQCLPFFLPFQHKKNLKKSNNEWLFAIQFVGRRWQSLKTKTSQHSSSSNFIKDTPIIQCTMVKPIDKIRISHCRSPIGSKTFFYFFSDRYTPKFPPIESALCGPAAIQTRTETHTHTYIHTNRKESHQVSVSICAWFIK